MGNSASKLAIVLERSNIRPTYPRIQVLAYLMAGQIHPIVEESSSLSKTMVYNMLKLLVDANLAKMRSMRQNLRLRCECRCFCSRGAG